MKNKTTNRHKIFLIAVGIAAAIFLAEFLSRGYVRQYCLKENKQYLQQQSQKPEASIYALDDYLGWKLAANSQKHADSPEFDVIYKINQQGLRDEEIKLPKPEQVFRVLALGESTVFGEGIKYGNRFTEVIEKSLRDVDIVNMGVQGFGIDQSYWQLEQSGLDFKPDLVVLFVAIDEFLQRAKLNKRLGQYKPRFVLDAKNNSLRLEPIDKQAYLAKAGDAQINDKALDRTKKMISRWMDKSNIIALFDYNNNIKINSAEKQKWQAVYDQLQEDRKNGLAYDKQQFCKFILLILEKYKKLCAQSGIGFLVVSVNTKEYDIAAMCLDAGIDCFDLSAVFNRANKAQRTHFKIDPHFNQFAHTVIGEYTADFLSRKYGLPRNNNKKSQYLGRF